MSYDKPPLIAISQRIDVLGERSETRDCLDQKLNAIILKIGLMPLPVPNFLEDTSNVLNSWLDNIRPQGVILSGGNDIGEYPARDITESLLINYAQNNRLPLIGICRGMQMIAHYFGVGLKPVKGHIDTEHNLLIVDKLIEMPKLVNSFHKFSIDSCPNEFEVIAYAQSGEIEAIRHKNLPWVAFMWHPERGIMSSEVEFKTMRNFFYD
jgi:gamma-glutamyl-gamma-aminobutyrate hydrolase PuuD